VKTTKGMKKKSLRFFYTLRDISGVVGHEAEISQKVPCDNSGEYSYTTGGKGYEPRKRINLV
jgi:hypothetical protein